MTATKKLTAYGAVVVAALVMGSALLTAAFAAPSVGDVSVTVAGDGDHDHVLKAIDDNRGELTDGIADADGKFTIETPAGERWFGVGDRRNHDPRCRKRGRTGEVRYGADDQRQGHGPLPVQWLLLY